MERLRFLWGWVGAVLAAATLAAQQAPFAPRAGRGDDPVRSVQLPGLLVQLRGDQLHLRDAAGDRLAPCTHPDGLGAVHAIDRTGFDQCVIAAANGLFVLDAEHPIADRADLRDGVPEGAMLGVVAMGDGRCFVCTPQQFGAVDLRYGYGFTFGARQQLPAGPFIGLARAGQQLVLRTANGNYAYHPDHGDAPAPASGELARDSLRTGYGQPVRFAPPVQAGSETTLRARRSHHHLIVPLVDGLLHGLRPGHHTVEVFAVDRDLRRREVGRYDVDVQLPPRFSTRWLPVTAGAAMLLVLLLAWPRRGRRRLHHALLRSGLLMVLSLQVLAALLGYGRSWPFMGFSMYTETYREGSLLYKPQVLGVRADGSTIALIDWDLGVRQDGYWQVLSELVHGPERQLARHLEIVQQRRPKYGVTGLRFTDTRIRLTRDGPVDVAPVVLRQWRQP